jgi:hypothetical protein
MASAQQILSFSSIVPEVTPLLLPQAHSPRFRADNSVSSHASVSGNRSRICQRLSCKPYCPFSSFLRREGEETRGGTRKDINLIITWWEVEDDDLETIVCASFAQTAAGGGCITSGLCESHALWSIIAERVTESVPWHSVRCWNTSGAAWS